MRPVNTIVTWLWKGNRDYRPEHVNLFGAMLERQMREPYELHVFTDHDYHDFDLSIYAVHEIPPAAERLAHLRTIEGEHFPTCFRRLWLFSDEARELFGGRQVLLTDLDAVVTADWSPLFEHDEPFVGWRPRMLWGGEDRLAGGMWLHRTGTLPHVWGDFVRDPEAAMSAARRAGYRGSDQAWLSYRLSGSAPTWPLGAGIYSHREFVRGRRDQVIETIPADARVVHFNGKGNAWDPDVQAQHPWVLRYLP